MKDVAVGVHMSLGGFSTFRETRGKFVEIPIGFTPIKSCQVVTHNKQYSY